MAAWVSQRTGSWSVTSDNAASPWHDGGAQTALASIPANTDTVTIADTHDVEFDVDQSGFAAGITLSIADGGTLHACTDAGSYYLMLQNADMTLAGTLRAGTDTDTPYPSTCTFTIDHNNNAKSIEVAATGHIYLYCTQPTNTYITITEAVDASTEKEMDVDTDVSSDWNMGDTVCVVDSTPLDVEYVTIDSITASTITITGAGAGGGLDSAIAASSIAVLVTRNIRIINVAASDYAITYASGAGSGDYIGAEISNCYRGFSVGSGFEFAGTCNLLTTFAFLTNGSTEVTVSGSATGPTSGTAYAVVNGRNCNITGLVAGWVYATTGGISNTVFGTCFGCTQALRSETDVIIGSSAIIDHCLTGLYTCNGLVYIYGQINYADQGVMLCSGMVLEASFTGCTIDLRQCGSGRSYNTAFGGTTEFSEYNTNYRAANSYIESFDHDQVTNAFKAWCRGGVVTSDDTLPPTGYDRWYQHACESADYPCFRQYETTVQPGQTIEVEGKIRIYAGDDHTAFPPALQIIDKFADPLVDNTQTPLDEDEIPEPDGDVEDDWQDVSVLWANQGDAPRQVIVRMIAQHATADVDEVWSVAGYQDQIAMIYNKIKRLGPTGQS